jgi:hypothetical protein
MADDVMALPTGAHDGLVGATGFVGTTLLRQRPFAQCYRSTDIDTIRGREFELLVCAGAPAQKWLANREPDADRASIGRLMDALGTVRARRCVLVSTVDVFAQPAGADGGGVDERTPVVTDGLHAYGTHRFELEEFVRERFPGALVARLPGLVGPGLRKNVVYDLHNGNNLAQVDSRGVFQFYPMVNLWWDLQAALSQGRSLLHLTAAPLAVSEVAAEGFGIAFTNVLTGAAARYDFRSVHAAGGYQYGRAASLQAIRAYAQSEPRADGRQLDGPRT